MNKSKILLVLGIWVGILPYLGFPSFFKNILFSLSGLALIYLAYILNKEIKIKKKVFDSFSENGHKEEKIDLVMEDFKNIEDNN